MLAVHSRELSLFGMAGGSLMQFQYRVLRTAVNKAIIKIADNGICLLD